MTEAAIERGITRDLYVALGEPLGDGSWALRVHIKPFVRWIWAGALLMMLGGLVTATDRRFRPKTVPATAPSAQPIADALATNGAPAFWEHEWHKRNAAGHDRGIDIDGDDA